MKKYSAAFAILSFFGSVFLHAQTNVSGGIFANTTWSLANSPYIATANVVVFPGYTLTIEPGVVVKFDAGVQLEIRQASLIALGTSTDSITFTSNTSASAGAWDQVYLNGGGMISKFAYCNFRYAAVGINDLRNTGTDSLIIRYCKFRNNTTGYTGTGTGYQCGIVEYSSFTNNSTGANDVYGTTMNYCDMSYNSTGFNCHSIDILNHCTLTHNSTGAGNTRNLVMNFCTVNNNSTGISAANGVTCNNCEIDSNSVFGVNITKTSQLLNCDIDYNQTGIYDHNIGSNPSNIRYNTIDNNAFGIQLSIAFDSIFCNHICNNTSYGLLYSGSSNLAFPRNYWCTLDSATVQTYIYDAHNNVNYGVVNFMPLDDGNCSSVTGITDNAASVSFSLFPNPVNSELTVNLPAGIHDAKIRIFNSLGTLCFSAVATGTSNRINVSNFASGLYFVEVEMNGNITRKKFIRE